MFLGLHLIPQRVHLGQIALRRGLAARGQASLNLLKSAGELGVGAAQGGLGLDPQMAAQIDHHEQQIAEFIFQRVCVLGVARFLQLGGFFGDLGEDMAGIGPVESHTRGPFLQLMCPQQGGQVGGHTVQRAFLFLARAFGSFDGLPVLGLLVGGFVTRFVTEYMRVPADHLVRHGADHILKGEMPGFLSHLRVKDRLEEKVAQLSLQLIIGLPFDGVGDLIGFLDRVGGDGGEILFHVPRTTALRVTQAAHDFQQALDTRIAVMDQRIFSHCEPFRSGVRCIHSAVPIRSPPQMPVVNRIADFAADMAKWRQHLHTIPELEFECYETAAFVAERLREFGVDELHEGIAKTGMVAIINGQGDGPTIGLRADMDALPIPEETGVEYASKNPGKMHACGHDGHTTMLLGAARYLAETRNFAGRVALIFQPAEEEGGGADVMVQEGIMDRFDISQVYGIHNDPGNPEGAFYTTAGPLMAAVDTFEIHVQGQGGHGALPHQTKDPVMAACGIAQAIQTIVSRNHYAVQDLVISVTQIHAGTVNNVIPDTAYLNGTVRTFDPTVQKMVIERMEQIVAGQAASYGVEATLDYQIGYPATINDAEKTAFAADVAREVSGEDRVVDNMGRDMGAEDFSYMLQARPGAYLFLGQGEGAGLHHPKYNFNDDIAPVGASFFARIVEKAQPLG